MERLQSAIRRDELLMFSWLTRWFRPARRFSEAGQAHMTFGQSSIGRSISQTGLFLKRQLWIWPIIAVVLLSIIGWGVSSAIQRTMQANLQSSLQTLLNVEVSMLKTWLDVQEANAESLAHDQQIRSAATEILNASQPLITDDAAPTIDAAATHRAVPARLNQLLAQELGPGMNSHDFVGYFLADKQMRILSATNPELVGQTVPQYEPFLLRALDGESTVSAPFASVVSMKDEYGKTRTGVPTMFVCAPIRDANFQVVAALALRIRPETEFTRILQLGQIGKSGETYAFDTSGMLVSSSRFDDSLILLGLLPDVEHANSILNVSVRDPGGNMQQGFRPTVRRAELPLTKMAESATSGNSGMDVDGYRDYRGVTTVGAWQWLPEYALGVATEIDRDEAFRPLTILRRVFYSLYALLAVGAIAIFVFTLIVARLQREAQKAAIEARQLGQYRLENRIGAGAMGVVYRGQHAMLRRPTAIKMLNLELVNETSIKRFECEVQITCKLNHPNTVAIYDYGRTPEGVFYYAMEYLDGIDLQGLVDRYGPQHEGRVIEILKQVCGSLYEAHSLGLVHRDIKPANLMLNRRGGEPDVVKVLDFGLVKALDGDKQTNRSGGMSGTPLYMSPEAIQTPDSVDPRSDLYAVGAVGYFLLTGQAVFNAASLVELCNQHVTKVPDAPSQRLGRAVSIELEGILLACLEKSPAKRPQTARDLALQLDRAPAAGSWTTSDAEAWWGRHERQQSSTLATDSATRDRTINGSQTGSALGVVSATTPSRSTAAPSSASSGFDRTIAPS